MSAEQGQPTRQKQDAAILALMSHRNVEDAARAVGVSPKTLFRWLREKDFKDAYRLARRESFTQSISRLQQASSAAVTTLLKVMVDPQAPHSSRVRAAECVLDRTMKAMELEDIDARLSRLEASQMNEDEAEGE